MTEQLRFKLDKYFELKSEGRLDLLDVTLLCNLHQKGNILEFNQLLSIIETRQIQPTLHPTLIS